MKWLGGGEGDGAVKVEMDRGPHRSQDDAAVGYVYQRPMDAEFSSFGPKHLRWALGDDCIVDNHDKWKYPVSNKMTTPSSSLSYIGPPNTTVPGLYDLAHNKSIPPEHLIYMANHPHQIVGGIPAHLHHPAQYISNQQQSLENQIPMRLQGQMNTPTKKIWEVDGKDPKSMALNHNHMNHDGVWRDSTWTASDQTVSGPLSINRRAAFAAGEVGNILSPRGTDNCGLGVKMVEYVLGGSPTNKDNNPLETRMRNLQVDDKDKDKPQTPKEDGIGQPMQNGQSDDDKAFNRTPGSRQPSPTDDDLVKNGIALVDPNILAMKGQEPLPPHLHQQLSSHMNPHLAVPLNEPVPPQLDHFGEQQHLAQQQSLQTVGYDHQSGAPTVAAVVTHQFPPQHQVDGTVLQQQHGFDVQQLFRSQQTQATATSAQLQLLQQQQQQQQQQYLAQQQQAAFSQQQYVLNAQQEPYLITTGVPPYYGVAPWMYPAPTNLVQQGANNSSRRPLTPNGTTEQQPQVQHQVPGGYIIPYYDPNSNTPVIMAQGAAMRNGTHMRLVSPAPVLVQSQTNRQNSNTGSIYSTAPQGIYGNNANTTINGGTLGGLGLTSSATDRRNSFDRTTSAFSPSLDYRQKWTTSYNIGNSPSPLTGNITPPSSTALPLGGLVASRVLSAAPGAEAKFRNSVASGIAANALLNSTNSLLTKLNSTFPVTPTNSLDKSQQGRSRLLEDFRNNRYPNLQLRELVNHIVEFSQDQHGSRFIQQKLERASATEKQMVFTEILSAAYNLMTDVFGNYVIQKFFEFGTGEQKSTLAQKVRGHVLPLALQMYGCRVIQKALESVPADQQQEIVRELDGHVLKCVKDQNGNHVVQKCIECVDPNALQFIIQSFSGQVYTLSTHPYGCRVIQRILEHCTTEQTAPILSELHQHTEQLIQDQFGNYVIQHVLEHGKQEDKSQLIASVRGKVLTLSQHKFASNVVEKCVTHATRAERALLIEEVCGFNDNALQVMMKDQYANYVVQKMIDVSEPTQRKVLMHKIRPHLSSLRKYTYGKHIISKLEKYFMKSTGTLTAIGNDLGPICPPTNGVI